MYRFCDLRHDPPADEQRRCDDPHEHDANDLNRTVHIQTDSLPHHFEVCRLIINILLDLLLDQFCQDADIDIQALHIFFIISCHERILLDLGHTVLKRVQTLQDPPKLRPRILLFGLIVQGLERPSRLIDHRMGALGIRQFSGTFRIHHDNIHYIIDVFLELNVIFICHGNIFPDRVIAVRKPVHRKDQIYDHDGERNKADGQKHTKASF